MKRILLMELLPAAAAPFAAEREREREDKSEVKCQYAIGQISQPDETQE